MSPGTVKEERRKQFYIELRNGIETLAEESGTFTEGSPQTEWDRIVKTYHAAATSTIGLKQKSHKEWLSLDRNGPLGSCTDFTFFTFILSAISE